jgi:hypothetical protein
MGINAHSRGCIHVGSAFLVAVALSATAFLPSRAETQTTPATTELAQGAALLERAVLFSRAHPRIRGRFQHAYFDRGRTTELRNHGTFVVELPRARIEIDGEEARSIAIDETFAHVLVPDGAAPLALSFRLETTPLPSLFALLTGALPVAELFTVRQVAAPGDAVLELRPVDPSALVDRIWLELASDGSITRFLVVDSLGGTHRVVLDGVRYPASIPAASFVLDVPASAVPVEP